MDRRQNELLLLSPKPLSRRAKKLNSKIENPELSLLMLAYYFPPRGGSGVQRSAKFAKFLPAFSIRPTVLTASELDITATRDDSLLTELEHVDIHRVSSGESWIKKAASLRLGPFISSMLRPDAHILWKRPVSKAVESLTNANNSRFDAIYVSLQPWSASVIALELKKKLGVPLIVDFRDPWIDSTSLSWPNKRHFNQDRTLEAKIFDQADAIIGVTPGMINCFHHRYPAASNKTHLIFNGYDTDDFEPLETASISQSSVNPESTESASVFKLGFAGRLYNTFTVGHRNWFKRIQDKLSYRNCETDFTTHSLRYLAPALARLFEKRPELRKSFQFDLAGNIPRSNIELVKKLGLSDIVKFHGLIPHADAIELVSRSDAVWLPMMTEMDGRRSFNASGKVFEYLALSKPILGLVPEGDAADIVRESKCGWVEKPDDIQGIMNLLESLIESKSNGSFSVQANRNFIDQFQRRKQASQLSKLLKQVTSQSTVSVQ